MHRHPRLAALLVFTLAAAPVAAQPPAAPAAIARDELTLEQAVAIPSVMDAILPELRWVPGASTLATVRPEGDAALAVTRPAPRGDWSEAFSGRELWAALAAAGATVKADDKPAMPAFDWLARDRVRVSLPDGIYHWTPGDAEATRVLRAPEHATAAAVAPGDEVGAWVVDHDLYVAARDGEPRRITTDGGDDVVYGGAAHRAEFGISDGLWWGPAGRRLAFSREDMHPIAPYPYADFRAQPPALVHGRYPMAGRRHSVVQIGVYDAETRELHYLESDPQVDQYQTNVTFSPDGTELWVVLVNRDQDRAQLVRFDAATGKRGDELLAESDAEWIEPEHGPAFVPGAAGQFLWFSPRDGYRHLYRYDAAGKCLGQVTRGAFDVASLVGFAADGRVLVMASGDNPLEMHLWSADLEGGEMRRLTTARGWHECALAPDGRFAIDHYSHLQLPGAVALLSTSGGPAVPIATAADPAAGYRLGTSEFFEVTAADGTVLHGLLLFPPGARDHGDARYPVVQYVYGGPHSQLVRDAWLGGARPWLYYLASRGFVVFQLDNRGTDNRGIEFSQAVFRRLGSLEIEDQARALAHVCALPFVDRERVGVHGWSYGGFMTLSLMTRRPGDYACGISGAPVTDWAQYETGYTERYMDTPQQNPEGYAEASVIERAGELQGRLLLIQGTDDKTVMFSHSMRFLQACIDAGVLVDFMAYPMQQHGIRGADRLHLYRTMTRFLFEQLRP